MLNIFIHLGMAKVKRRFTINERLVETTELKIALEQFIRRFDADHKGDLHGVPVTDIVLYSAARQWLSRQ